MRRMRFCPTLISAGRTILPAPSVVKRTRAQRMADKPRALLLELRALGGNNTITITAGIAIKVLIIATHTTAVATPAVAVNRCACCVALILVANVWAATFVPVFERVNQPAGQQTAGSSRKSSSDVQRQKKWSATVGIGVACEIGGLEWCVDRGDCAADVCCESQPNG